MDLIRFITTVFGLILMVAGNSYAVDPEASSEAGREDPTDASEDRATARQPADKSARGETTEVQGSDLGQLQKQLSQRGWITKRDAEGNLLLYPLAADSGAPQPAPPDELDRLQHTLEQRGWKTERDAAGDLIFYPEQGPPAPAEPPEEIQAAEGRVMAGDLDQLELLLESRGWHVQHDEAGNLLITPHSTDTTGADANSTFVNRLGDLQWTLEARGWRTDRDDEGNLILYPQKSGRPAVQSAAAFEGTQPCRFILVEPVRSGSLRLPVDSWDEAHTIARSYLDEHAMDDLSVGKIRHINRIYLVSLVTRAPPYRLHDQLAIRTDNGLLVSLARQEFLGPQAGDE